MTSDIPAPDIGLGTMHIQGQCLNDDGAKIKGQTHCDRNERISSSI